MSEHHHHHETGTRLRRRSFYESLESETPASSTQMETIALHDSGTTSHHAYHSSSSSVGADSSAGGSSASATASGSSSTSDSSSGVWGILASIIRVIGEQLWYVKTWLTMQLQAVGLFERFGYGTDERSKRTSTTETLVNKQYVYPTHWIKLACASMIVLQCLLYTYFEFDHLSLHVEECVFNERMMSAVPARERILASATAASNAAAMRFLDRRFEQQIVPVQAQHNIKPRLPWTCISVVPTAPAAKKTDTAAKTKARVISRQAHELAFLLPRSQVVPLAETPNLATRLYLALGSGSPIDRSVVNDGVMAAMFPLSSFSDGLFPQGFPDLMLVKSEYALKKLVLYRHERQEEFEHRVALRDIEENDVKDQEKDKEEQAKRKIELSKTQFGVFLLKTAVPDIYDRTIVKDWDAFLHVVVISEQDKKEQLTKEILTLWMQHPEWPTLHVRFQQSLTLCGSFQRFITSQHQLTDDDGEFVADRQRGGMPSNIDLTCDPVQNTHDAIITLKNSVGFHLFPVPPEMEVYEELVLESASAGAIVVTYNTPIMQEWIPDAIGVRVGTYETPDTGGLLDLPVVDVSSSDIEHAVEGLLQLDRVHRVASGRAARVQYLEIRTHYLSALAALDSALCDFDSDENLDQQQHEIGQRSRKRVDMDVIRVFLY
ncbi:hypothetical protein Poli38472_007372 [Pythium oligandrum]|uniref:Uncharacterized protein n=1 Tax=Pythium oligandrum TaxID=41045 RepID=A0A8K1C9U6_PYTOL|nr:hypothetical protein Poli38472_007372 [Pythium oligandrum]|eukprot:TMW59227.1 hypothetical protein Poli38472_007372 [Pythium oligandrum]